VAKTKQTNSTLSPRIRTAILKIPRGKVSSYGAVAKAAGFPRAARQVVRVLNQSHGLHQQQQIRKEQSKYRGLSL